MYNTAIKNGLKKGQRNEIISRKIYITYPTFAFQNLTEIEFDILNSIADQFKTPLTSIHVAGSSKTGYSYHQSKNFVKGESDLDIAIIDSPIFLKYCEIVADVTKGFSDLSRFSRSEGSNNYNLYCKYIAKGFFRPDIMPACEEKKSWFNFFSKLSDNYVDYFLNVNAGIYFSLKFFEQKQSENIELFKRSNL